MKSRPDEKQLEALAAQAETPATDSTPAPSEVKSRLYSALLRLQEESGPLLSLTASKAAGSELCVFEDLVQVAPLGEATKSFNCCSVCHARILAERFSNVPIFWDGCPYVAFQDR